MYCNGEDCIWVVSHKQHKMKSIGGDSVIKLTQLKVDTVYCGMTIMVSLPIGRQSNTYYTPYNCSISSLDSRSRSTTSPIPLNSSHFRRPNTAPVATHGSCLLAPGEGKIRVKHIYQKPKILRRVQIKVKQKRRKGNKVDGEGNIMDLFCILTLRCRHL